MRYLISLCVLCFLSLQIKAQSSNEELAMLLANPIAPLFHIPVYNNTDVGIGDWEGARNTLDLQVVFPISITPSLSLITRLDLPVIAQYTISEPREIDFGLGDMMVSGFLSPSDHTGALNWGVGYVVSFPTGIDEFSIGKFGLGPTAVALIQEDAWTFGGLIRQVWGFGEDGGSRMFLRPFAAYIWPSGAGFGVDLEWTQDWRANQGNLWLNPTLSAVTNLGEYPVQLILGPRFNIAAHDGNGANWGIRTGIEMVIFR